MESLDYKIDISSLDLVKRIWENERDSLKFPPNFETAIKNLIKIFFNPIRKKSTIINDLQRLPKISSFNSLEKISLEKLERDGLILIVKVLEEAFITLTPSGLCYISSIKEGEEGIYGYDEDFDLRQQLENFVLIAYEDIAFKKILDIKRELESNLEKLPKKSTKKYLAALLFLLLNNSVGEDDTSSIDLKKSEKLTKVWRDVIKEAFNLEIGFNDYSGLIYFVTELNRYIGPLVEIKRRKFFIKRENLDIIYNKIFEIVEFGGTQNEFLQDWEKLKREYSKRRHILDTFGVSHYSKSWEYKLDNIFYSKLKTKRRR